MDSTNATVLDVRQATEPNGSPQWSARIRLDSGAVIAMRWTAPEVVRIMARAKCSLVHFGDARCRVEGDVMVAIHPNTPFPIA
ncbi:MAG: hypothetical protein GEU73_04225 [Chloroflexi bacterium]|nr:hypothetical protein [Chloroflexota bacterium]